MAPYVVAPFFAGQQDRVERAPPVLAQYWDVDKWRITGWRARLWWLDWFLRPHKYVLVSPYVFGIWLMYVGFLVGGICFTIGSFAGATPQIYRTSPQNEYEYEYDDQGNPIGLKKDGMANAYDWLVLFTYEFGSVAWVISMFGGIWEATNDDYHHRLREWERNGKQGRKPWFRWLWVSFTNVRWYGAWIYMCGCIAYLVAASALVWQTKEDSRFLTLTEYKAMVNKMYLLGGVTFFCAAPFYIYSWIDSTVIGGIMPLPWRLQVRASKWWAWLIFFWSGASFFAGGVCYMFMYAIIYPAEEGKFTGKFTFLEFQEITALAFGVGSLGYTLGSLFALAWTSELLLAFEAELHDRALGLVEDLESSAKPSEEVSLPKAEVELHGAAKEGVEAADVKARVPA